MVNVNPAARDQLPAIRELLFAGRFSEAEQLCGKYLLGRPDQFGTALPLGFLEIETLLTAPPVAYRRSLDLEAAVAHVAFASGGLRFRREVVASHPHDVIAVRLESDIRGSLSCTVAFSTPRLPGDIATEGGDLLLRGHAWERVHSDGRHGVSFVSRVRVVADGGTVRAEDGRITVRTANSVTLLIAIASDFGGGEPERLCAEALTKASSVPWRLLRAAHVRDHTSLFHRVSLDLGHNPAAAALPVDERRKRVAGGDADPELCALFFQYGRYLTIAGSRQEFAASTGVAGNLERRTCRSDGMDRRFSPRH